MLACGRLDQGKRRPLWVSWGRWEALLRPVCRGFVCLSWIRWHFGWFWQRVCFEDRREAYEQECYLCYLWRWLRPRFCVGRSWMSENLSLYFAFVWILQILPKTFRRLEWRTCLTDNQFWGGETFNPKTPSQGYYICEQTFLDRRERECLNLDWRGVMRAGEYPWIISSRQENDSNYDLCHLEDGNQSQEEGGNRRFSSLLK